MGECVSLGPPEKQTRCQDSAKTGLNIQESYSCRRNSEWKFLTEKIGRDPGKADRPQYRVDPELKEREKEGWGEPSWIALQSKEGSARHQAVLKPDSPQSSLTSRDGWACFSIPVSLSQGLGAAGKQVLNTKAAVDFRAQELRSFGHLCSLWMKICEVYTMKHKSKKALFP